MHKSLCICADVPSIAVTSRLCLVMHRDEMRKTTNTGRLAARCLAGSEVLVHGREDVQTIAPWQQSGGSDIVGGLLLFPCDEAEALGPHHLDNGPVRLVVPDGTWRQATKMTRRIPWMATLPRVSLPEGRETTYRLRSEPKEGGLATLEAIARAFAVLEGPEVEEQLYEIFRRMVDRTLYSRGLLSREQVHGGVPEGTVRHEPRALRPWSSQ